MIFARKWDAWIAKTVLSEILVLDVQITMNGLIHASRTEHVEEKRRKTMTNEYIRREDAKIGLSKTFGRLNADIANYVIDKVEPADVVPVVRCKDCNYHSFDAESGRWWCNLTSGVRKVNHDDFCSEGKRKGT